MHLSMQHWRDTHGNGSVAFYHLSSTVEEHLLRATAFSSAVSATSSSLGVESHDVAVYDALCSIAIEHHGERVTLG